MTVFYTALGIFVSTSVAIGVVAAIDGTRYAGCPSCSASSARAFLFYGSILLIFEARLALSHHQRRDGLHLALGKTLAPAELVDQRSPHYNRLTLKRRRR